MHWNFSPYKRNISAAKKFNFIAKKGTAHCLLIKSGVNIYVYGGSMQQKKIKTKREINNKMNKLQRARIIIFLQSHLSSFQLQLARVSCNHHCSRPESSCTASCDIFEGTPLWFQLDQSETERSWTKQCTHFQNYTLGSITSRCSRNEPTLLPWTDSSWGGLWESGGATWINDNLSPMDSRDSKKILRAEFPNVQTKRFSAWKECLLKILRVTPVNKMKKQETARRQFTRKCTCRKTRSIWLSWSSPTSHKAISFPYLFGQHQKLLTSGQIRKKSLLRLQKRVHYMLITCKLKKPSTRSLRTDSQLERGESEPSATWRGIPQATLG